MIRIPVHASRSYEVLIERGLSDRVGELTAELVRGRHAVLVSETRVAPLHADRIEVSLKAAGFAVDRFVFPAGEESKNAGTYLALISFLAQHAMTRADVLVALGGGVTGDLTGFAAATYLRGIACIQIPTTLLSCVDSSVGGKTAVDLPEGKNLLGAFSQPKLVVCDPDLLRTLPKNIFADGCAEVIKAGMICSPAFLEQLEQTHAKDQLENVLSFCIGMKRDVVEDDEFDTGNRRMLNLGHTFGHAVEKLSNFELSHGSAVAIGLMIITRASERRGICPKGTAQRLEKLIRGYDLPTETTLTAAQIAQAAGMDKKRMASRLMLVVPAAYGKSELLEVNVSELEAWAKEGLEA